MVNYSSTPILLPVTCNRVSLMMCVIAALGFAGWEISKHDGETLLPSATKRDAYHSVFLWCDSDANEVDIKEATHLAVIVGSRSAPVRIIYLEQVHLVATIRKMVAAATAVNSISA